MPEEQSTRKGGDTKSSAESALIALRKASERAEKELKDRVARLEQELSQERAKSMDLEEEREVLSGYRFSEDQEVEGVRQKLITKERQLAQLKKEAERKTADLSSLESQIAEREKKVRARELVMELGLSADEAEKVLGSENPEAEALSILATKLSQAKSESSSPGYESGMPLVTGRSVMDMKPEEFDAHVAKLRLEALKKGRTS